MGLSRWANRAFKLWVAGVLAFIYIPLLTVFMYALDPGRTQRWPTSGVSLKWFSKALQNDGFWSALWMSARVGFLAAGIAIVLGTLAAFAVQRYSFFGRDAVTFAVIIPIALPGIVTGIALNSTFSDQGVLGGVPFGIFTIVVGHGTFCIVTVYNNVIARLRRLSPSFEEAAADLGATRWQTFTQVIFPQVRSSLLAGGLLAFALSFDEIIVTKFTVGGSQTLPLWIETNFSRPNQVPITYAVACIAVILSIVPAWIAQRRSGPTPGPWLTRSAITTALS